MRNRISDYDLSFLKDHYIYNVSYSNTTTTFSSIGPDAQPNASIDDSAGVTLECEIELNGEKVERSVLLKLLNQVYKDCWIDEDFNLHLEFASGDKIVALRKSTGFESYNIDWSCDPMKSVTI